MKCVALFLAVLVVHGTVAAAFSPFGIRIRIPSTALYYFPDNYNRAVECATHYGKCHVEELEQLANELNEFQHDEFKGSCLFEKDEEACQKDWQEMNHVKQLLKVQTKLHQMTDAFVEGRHHDEPETFDLADIF